MFDGLLLKIVPNVPNPLGLQLPIKREGLVGTKISAI
jgi:hypothetical protein